ncbi:50S ribosomal protein L21 [Spirochaeta isovalerica]|uniref:Large ribosomal subunit protein bL21 n=1 Tax=Spirochaeta isovalerica TaxID=150 RepID=A0A841R1Z2_9SPIO|nr:50S ribosomal protein L21 [Spirochaeta isovalerica]MBB6479034.1 large subunit ribosomal protein L21 [Spirochaeta isovalerica]
MYALVEIKGKQYKAEKGSVLRVDRFDAEAGQSLELDKVMLVSDDKETKIGTPYVDGAKVTAKIGETIKDKKVIVFKKKRRKGYKKTQGHRQQYTMLTVEDIKL